MGGATGPMKSSVGRQIFSSSAGDRLVSFFECFRRLFGIAGDDAPFAVSRPIIIFPLPGEGGEQADELGWFVGLDLEVKI